MIVGQGQPDSGTLRLGDTVKISYVDQNRAGLEPDKTVREVVFGPAATAGDVPQPPLGRVPPVPGLAGRRGGGPMPGSPAAATATAGTGARCGRAASRR
jgi:hypothetical protein